MAHAVVRFQETPNPNAIKCVVEGRFADAPRSYFNAEQAAADSLAAALFALPGVTNVLIHEEFVTVGKSPAADWGRIKPGVERVLREAR